MTDEREREIQQNDDIKKIEKQNSGAKIKATKFKHHSISSVEFFGADNIRPFVSFLI